MDVSVLDLTIVRPHNCLIFLVSQFLRHYFNRTIREVIGDYALTVGVLFFSFLASYLFIDIEVDRFQISENNNMKMANLTLLDGPSIGIAALLGFLLAVLFFMDQNITAAYVNRPENKLQKGSAYHWDLLAMGLLNGVTSLYGLPFMHGILPHSYLQVLALADIVEVEESNGRRTRLE